MNLIFSIVRRELLARPNRPRFYSVRQAVVGVFASVFLSMIVIALHTRIQAAGATILGPIFFLLVFAACCAAPWVFAPAVAREREEKTLELLFLTDVRPWQFVAAKLVSGLFDLGLALLSCAPFMILAASLGGITALQVLEVLAVILSALLFGSCLGLAASALAPDARRALIYAVAGILVFVLALPASLCAFASQVFGKAPEDVLPVVSAGPALATILAGPTPWVGLWNAPVNAGLAILFLAVAIAATRRTAVEPEAAPLAGRRRRVSRLPAETANPVPWKESVRARRALPAWLLCAITVPAAMFAASLLQRADLLPSLPFGNEFDFPEPAYLWSATLVVSLFAFCAGLTASCVLSFAREKRARTLDLLLLTDLSGSEVILGKLWAPVRSRWPWLLAAAASVLALIAISPRDWRAFVLASVTGSAVSFALACSALWASLALSRHVAAGSISLLFVVAACAVPATFAAGGGILLTVAALAGANVALAVLFDRYRRLSWGETP